LENFCVLPLVAESLSVLKELTFAVFTNFGFTVFKQFRTGLYYEMHLVCTRVNEISPFKTITLPDYIPQTFLQLRSTQTTCSFLGVIVLQVLLNAQVFYLLPNKNVVILYRFK
jgi:hypothetical protein